MAVALDTLVVRFLRNTYAFSIPVNFINPFFYGYVIIILILLVNYNFLP